MNIEDSAQGLEITRYVRNHGFLKFMSKRRIIVGNEKKPVQQAERKLQGKVRRLNTNTKQIAWQRVCKLADSRRLKQNCALHTSLSMFRF